MDGNKLPAAAAAASAQINDKLYIICCCAHVHAINHVQYSKAKGNIHTMLDLHASILLPAVSNTTFKSQCPV